LDIKKKLPALKKKWGTNKADAYTRIVWMRAGDNYVRIIPNIIGILFSFEEDEGVAFGDAQARCTGAAGPKLACNLPKY
jgi:hypothetical protein